jgi:hypothetical protein
MPVFVPNGGGLYLWFNGPTVSVLTFRNYLDVNAAFSA